MQKFMNANENAYKMQEVYSLKSNLEIKQKI